MSVRMQYDTALAPAGSANGIATSQTPAGAADLTLDGALSSSGVATLDTNGNARQVLVTTISNESTKTLTIYGKVQENGGIVSETITGPNATTGTTTNHFLTVTRVAVSAAFTGAVTVGTNGVGASPWKAVNRKMVQFIASVVTLLKSGAVNWTIQWTHSDIFDGTVIPVAFSDANIAAKAANFEGSRTTPAMAIRTLINSGTGTVTTIVEQGDRVS